MGRKRCAGSCCSTCVTTPLLTCQIVASGLSLKLHQDAPRHLRLKRPTRPIKERKAKLPKGPLGRQALPAKKNGGIFDPISEGEYEEDFQTPLRTTKQNSENWADSPIAVYSGIRLDNRFQELDEDEENEIFLRLLRKHKLSPLKTPVDRAIVRQNTQHTPIQMKNQSNRSDPPRDSVNDEDRSEQGNKNRYEQVQVEEQDTPPRHNTQKEPSHDQQTDQDRENEAEWLQPPSRRRAAKRPMDARSPQTADPPLPAARRNTGPTPAKVRELPLPPAQNGTKGNVPPPVDTSEDIDMAEVDQPKRTRQNTQEANQESDNQNSGNGNGNAPTQQTGWSQDTNAADDNRETETEETEIKARFPRITPKGWARLANLEGRPPMSKLVRLSDEDLKALLCFNDLGTRPLWKKQNFLERICVWLEKHPSEELAVPKLPKPKASSSQSNAGNNTEG